MVSRCFYDVSMQVSLADVDHLIQYSGRLFRLYVQILCVLYEAYTFLLFTISQWSVLHLACYRFPSVRPIL